MKDLTKDVQENIRELEHNIKLIEDFLSNAPEGCLKHQQ